LEQSILSKFIFALKEELLETRNFGNEEFSFSFSTNRIIVSNAQDNESELIDTIKTRSEL